MVDLKAPDSAFSHSRTMVGFIYKKIKTFVSQGKELFHKGYSIFLGNAEKKKKPKWNYQETRS